jgi:hypothetical protein
MGRTFTLSSRLKRLTLDVRLFVPGFARASPPQLVLFRFREVSMRCARSRGSTPRTRSFSEIVGSLRSDGAAGIDARIMFRGEEM